jgi:hypothetical protein
MIPAARAEAIEVVPGRELVLRLPPAAIHLFP